MDDKRGEIIIYKDKAAQKAVDVRLEDNTVWLSQKQMSTLFGKDVRTINEHINNVFKDGELAKNSTTIRKFRIVQSEGGKDVRRTIDLYNLDVIISVGYRVKSQAGIKFRIWATKILHNFVIKGFVLNNKRLAEKFDDFEKAVNLIKSVMNKKALSGDEKSGLLKVVTDYAGSWIMLQKYDRGKLATPAKAKKSIFSLDHEYAAKAIEEIKKELLKKKEASDIFGRERERGLDSILKNLNQSFNGRALYPSIEEKAAHLLYFVIKDHPFVDGNKRIGSFLFIVFLARNNYLYDKTGEKKFNDNALVALALLIAESKPKDKEIMIKLVVNLVFG